MNNVVVVSLLIIAAALSNGVQAGSESKDYTACKRLVEELHPEAKIQPRKIRTRFIDLLVRKEGEPKETIRCIRSDYSLVEREE